MNIAAIVPVLAGVTDEYARLTIKSLAETTDYKIIVVSSGGGPKPDFSDLPIANHLHTDAQGQCIATNMGAIAAGRADYLFITNDDMYYAPGWNKYLSHPDDWVRVVEKLHYPVFSPNLVEPSKPGGSAPPFLNFEGGNTLEDFDRPVVDKFITETIAEGKDVPYNYSYEKGLNLPLFVEKDFWDYLGGYDEAYDPWGSNSDTDLQTRINLAGVTPMRLRDLLVYHFSNKSGTFDGTHQDFYTNNIEYFKSKFGFDRDQLHSDVWYNKDMLPPAVAEAVKRRPYESA